MTHDAQPDEGAIKDLLTGIGDRKHIERDRASKRLEALIKQIGDHDDKLLKVLDAGIKSLLASNTWEQCLGGLISAKVLIDSGRSSNSFEEHAMAECLRLLEDDEVRVRLAVGNCLHALAVRRGTSVYAACSEAVVASIHENFDREGEGTKAGLDSSAATPAATGSPLDSPSISRASSSNSLMGLLLQSSYRLQRPGTGELRHGTEGWKSLETSVRALQQMVDGCGPAIRPYLTPDVRQLLYRTIHHPNRFVRETGHLTICTVCQALAGKELADIGDEIATRVADGLCDGWSQVRYPASIAARTFLQSLPPEERDRFLPVLLGPMCLNRYYVAEGVRLYSQETWRLVMGDQGRAKVAQFINEVVSFYVAQSKANNHDVRESTCMCIAELMEKVDRAAVAPHVPKLLHALIVCFKDMGWPVRDAACNACGRCVVMYPEEAKPVLQELYSLWFAHLWDNIPSVRRNSAVALASAVQAYGQDALQRVLAVVRDMLPKAHQQPADKLEVTAGKDSAASQHARDNDAAAHTDQDMFSCGSLTSRFGQNYYIKSDGCMDYGFSRERQPWEASDGAVHMLREVSCFAPEAVQQLLPAVADLACLSSFQQAFHLKETIWKSVPTIAKNLGKQQFRRHLDLLLPIMLTDLTCGNQLCEAAAGRCMAAMQDMLGPVIFAGRLSEEQRQLVKSNPNVPSAMLPS